MVLGKATLGNCLAVIVAVTSAGCASRVETLRTFPPAADLRTAPEPPYPEAALDSKAIEDAWWNEVLLWGRDNRDRVTRICKWAVDLGFKAPPDFCD